MKVIFLDFNAVLDTYYSLDEIDKDNLLRLKKIVSDTGASIVISYSIIKELINILLENDIDVTGITHSKDSFTVFT